jgi:hypothetical protein
MKKLLLGASIMLAAPSAHAATEALHWTFPGVQFYVTWPSATLMRHQNWQGLLMHEIERHPAE